MCLLKSLINSINRSIRNKLILSFIGITVIPLVFVSYISYSKFSAEIKDNYINSNTDLLNQAVSRLDDYFSQLNGTTISMRVDEALRKIPHPNESSWILHDKKISTLYNIYYQSRDINSIIYYYPLSKELFVVNSAFGRSFQNAGQIEETGWYGRLIVNPREFMIDPAHRLEGYKDEYRINSRGEVFTIYRYFTLGFRSRIYGVTAISYDLDTIREICCSLIRDKSETVIYLNNDSEVFFASDIDDYPLIKESSPVQWEKSGYFEFTKNNGKWIAVYSKSESSGNVIFKLISWDVLRNAATNTQNIILITCGTIILILLIASILISYHITKPLSELRQSMARVSEGDFRKMVSVETKDEIGDICSDFNIMAENINHLLNEKYRMRLLYRTSQLKALQAQINPHFLNNILQGIGTEALKINNKVIYNMIVALSEMLKYTIKSDGDIVTIADEIENVENYLFLQNFRFRERLNYTIDIPKSVYRLKIPKLVLQPIIENAVIHGLEPGIALPGLLIVKSVESGGLLEISISDNGVGISEPELLKINSGLLDLKPDAFDITEGIGILNVFYRLRIVFGEKCAMSVESELNKGTRVNIHIPVN